MGKSGMDKRIFEAIASTVKAGRANSDVGNKGTKQRKPLLVCRFKMLSFINLNHTS